MVIHVCETLGRSGMEVHFSYIRRNFWRSFASVSGGVGSIDRSWILQQSCTACSAVSSSTPHFLQMVSTAHTILCSQYLNYWWCPLLR